MRRVRAPVVIAVMVPLCVGGPAMAQPAQGEPELSPAVRAALGAPPSESPPQQGNYDPGYTDRGQGGTADQIYGSTATTVGPDGTLMNGLQIQDPNLLQEYRNDIEVPEYHIVQQGDTLWDISAYYMSDPYLWPKLWSWNDHVTNAHWIFPGDRIRLHDPYSEPSVSDEPDLALSKTRTPRRVK
ncbi:MAG: LysM peptidoglycan-binding domain-containing protein, partial [Myxococcales bacterium]|nr:LysM peptidoglycan-binding domain-containing protein [Myxococcales bacterium]